MPDRLARQPIKDQVIPVTDDVQIHVGTHAGEHLGSHLWPSAWTLSRLLASAAFRRVWQSAPPPNVLELGAGCGLVGLVAARLGARVTLTVHALSCWCVRV